MTPLPDHQPSTKSTHVSKWQLLRQSSAAQGPTHRYPAAPKKVDLGVTAEGWRGCTIRCPPPRTITARRVDSLASPAKCAPHSAVPAIALLAGAWCLRETQRQGQIAMVDHWLHPSHLRFSEAHYVKGRPQTNLRVQCWKGKAAARGGKMMMR